MLGQCEAYVDAIRNSPILPNHYESLMHVALLKGAQATTAIEGNTLSDEEVEKIMQNKRLPPSKEYQEIEVRNLIDAFNVLLDEVVSNNFEDLISIDLLKRFHKMVGKNLGEHFQAIPGRLRENDAYVGTYRCPDYRDVEELLANLTGWLKQEFKFNHGEQSFTEKIIQAIITHVYIEWIHPFGDGNGRTGRLVEFYILLRGGNPDITSHILSNYYNQTRPEYYRQLEVATSKGDLTEFLKYAIMGFRDGLRHTLEIIQKSQFEITWQKMVYNKFDEFRDKMSRVNKDAFKRQRAVALASFDHEFTADNMILLSPEVARQYINTNIRTIKSDIERLKDMKLLIEVDKKLHANLSLMKGMTVKSKTL
jgi:Fic family protein